MAARLEDGVVDKNCKVFWPRNSFFGGRLGILNRGHSNLMTTIVALATRLGEHLRDLHLTDQSVPPLHEELL
jgi:hypothetical protein